MKTIRFSPRWIAFAVLITGAACVPGVSTLTPAQDQTTPPAMQNTIQAAVQATLSAKPTATLAAVPSPTVGTKHLGGAISGKLTYPAEALPPLRVVAFNLDSDARYIIDVRSGDEYTLTNLPAGRYHVVAYIIPGPGGVPSEIAGGYTQAVPCGLSVDCTDHSLKEVEVTAGQTTNGIDPGDWYAPQGSFPSMPAYP
jgi:hypothetical protein